MPLRTHRSVVSAAVLVGAAAGITLADDVVVPADVLIEFASQPTADDVSMIEALGGTVHEVWTVVPGMHATVPAGIEDQLVATNDRVVSISPNARGVWTSEYDQLWGVTRINCEPVHASGQRGTGVAVAVLDSGLRATHAELAENFVFGYNFEEDNEDFTDQIGHGTHVSGTVVAAANGTDSGPRGGSLRAQGGYDDAHGIGHHRCPAVVA